MWLREEREKAWGWTEEGDNLKKGKMRDKDRYRENGSKGACGATRQGFRGTYIAWDWIEGDLYLMSREKTSIVVEGKDQSCDCRVREEDCVTLALQSETWEKERSPGSEIQNY